MATFRGRRAVFYIADGHRYLSEACVSVRSMKEHVPEIESFLFTPSNNSIKESGKTFDNIITVPGRVSNRWFFDHTRYMVFALEALQNFACSGVIYMDTDTFCCDDVSDVFVLLEQYDFAGAHAPGRYTTKVTTGVPASFPEINLGFNPMMNINSVVEMWKRSLYLYQKHPDTYTNNDQGPLRDALWQMSGKVKLYVLPPEYNLRFNFPCFASRGVKILHGHCDDYQQVIDQINSTGDMRVWHRNRLLD